MTALPAEQFRLKNRGALKKRNFADVVVFDPNAIQENTTYADPHQLSDGMDAVIVNGTLTMEDGELTGNCHGRFLG